MTLHARIIVVAGLAIGLASCQSAGVRQDVRQDVRQEQYPAEIQGIGDTPNYPMVAAGFNRAEILTYAPGLVSISTAYNIVSPEMQIAATIYRSSKDGRAPNLSGQYLAEKEQIEKYHAGTEILNEGAVVISKNGIDYSARRASFRYNEIFMGRRQDLYSELILIEHEDKYIKLRSTAPIAQEEIARKKNVELLDAVNWAN